MAKSDRDPDKWRSRENTRVKHDILIEYLKGFIPVLSAAKRGEPISVLHYVDSRAGRGWYEGGEPGSPIIAMRVGQELHEYLEAYRDTPVYLECYNVEYDRAMVASTRCPRREITAYGSSRSPYIRRLTPRCSLLRSGWNRTATSPVANSETARLPWVWKRAPRATTAST